MDAFTLPVINIGNVKYIEQYNMLKASFDLGKDEIMLPDGTMKIRNYAFTSTAKLPVSVAGQSADNAIAENFRFRYPVLMPAKQKKADKAIILLHGLNERTWHKHLAGAKYLCENSGTAVIMFPLSFHINRGLPEWTDARKMSALVELRKQRNPDVKESSIINFALSERLTEYPERFYISGYQSIMDLIHLMEDIKHGRHPLFEENTHLDLFAYSISCMLLQSLMLSNLNQILSKSKIILFAGGALFSHIQGVSKFIMDSVAFSSIRRFYLGLVTGNTPCEKELQPWIWEHEFGQSFLSLITPDFQYRDRKKGFRNFSDNLMVLSLRKDQIMPVKGIQIAMGEKFASSGRFRILDFSYAYSHENPFPVLYHKLSDQVDRAFQSVFTPALNFLAS